MHPLPLGRVQQRGGGDEATTEQERVEIRSGKGTKSVKFRH